MAEDRLIPGKRTVILKMEFSPSALRLDEFASTFSKNSVLGCILHTGARILSVVTPHVSVELSVCEEDEDVRIPIWSPPPTYWLVFTVALDIHRQLLLGNSMVAKLPMAILLLWRFNYSSSSRRSGFTDILSSLKRIMPKTGEITIDQTMNLPIAYALYKKSSYMPPPDLLTIKKSC